MYSNRLIKCSLLTLRMSFTTTCIIVLYFGLLTKGFSSPDISADALSEVSSEGGNLSITISPTSIKLFRPETHVININLWGVHKQTVDVNVTLDNEDVARVNPSRLSFPPNVTSQNVTVTAIGVGTSYLQLTSDVNITQLDEQFVRIQVQSSKWLTTLVSVIGWIYFACWSLCYYPQLIKNFRNKSVVGLSFDFQSTTLTGHISYAVFNSCMFWSPHIMELYKLKHPRGVNPVLINDVIFSLHASVANICIGLQCIFLERGGQRISWLFRGFLSAFLLTYIICLILSLCSVLSWLEYVYIFSYIKMAVTIIKYAPQVYLNYKNKGIQGFSITFAILDLGGGTFSVIQMFLHSYNNNDWDNIRGDPSKLALGIFSIVFDVIFIIQNFIIYRGSNSEPPKIPSNNNTSLEAVSGSETHLIGDKKPVKYT